jgi:hypothetical protein
MAVVAIGALSVMLRAIDIFTALITVAGRNPETAANIREYRPAASTRTVGPSG